MGVTMAAPYLGAGASGVIASFPFMVVTPGPTVLLALNNTACYGISRATWGIIGAAADCSC
ncbi:hypothetical protein F384_12575 [Citrobacter amalonaticus Y19]|uniref:Uncharacterized protein n=2 Tax=Citrobacter amalonaticus TaxID=35703 RepID=A0A0F6RFF6_CITAM|nr:hypothetical protein F384_12575 [Citrobacter amalonaticus Y19]